MSKDNGGPASDRELLEMAAKAAGYNVSAYDEDDYGDAYGLLHGERWSPLTDDGDALRLAVKLNMKLEKVVSCLGSAWVADGRCMESVSSDQMVSVRRAIVSAAAAIGSAM